MKCLPCIFVASVAILAAVAGSVLILTDSLPFAKTPLPRTAIEFVTERGERDLVRVAYPMPQEGVTSPLVVSGEARGFWFFEASFPIVLVDWDGRIIAEHYAEAKSEWMTEDFVPFEGVLEFTRPFPENGEVPDFMRRGALIIKKDNPSGLSEHDDSLEIPVVFK